MGAVSARLVAEDTPAWQALEQALLRVLERGIALPDVVVLLEATRVRVVRRADLPRVAGLPPVLVAGLARAPAPGWLDIVRPTADGGADHQEVRVELAHDGLPTLGDA